MRRPVLLLAVALVSMAAPASAAKLQKLADVKAAVASPLRTAENLKLDESRKPAEILRYAGIREGMKVADLFGGNLYWAEMLSPMVGDKGLVTVWQPTQFQTKEGKAFFAKFAAKANNVHMLESPMEAPNLPHNAYDFVMLNLNYHDIYWRSDKYGVPMMKPDKWVKAVYNSLKRGGQVMVIDHIAERDTGPRESVEKWHRIDPWVIRKDFRKAGFSMMGYSNILRNNKDDLKVSVFDEKVRGKTDRVVMRFRKPI